MATKNTSTQKELFARIIAHMSDDAEVVAMCKKKIAQLTNKASSATAKRNEADEPYFIAITEVLADGTPKRATEIMNAISASFDPKPTIQKVTSMLTKMVAAGEIVKSVDKKVSTFTLAPVDEVAED